MQLSDVDLLTSSDGRLLLSELPPYDDASALQVGDRMRRAGHPAGLVAAVLTQSRLRTRAERRWGPEGHALLQYLLLTPDGAEQATRPTVAALRAERYRRLPVGRPVADLGCGIGVDALALAAAGMAVDAYDIDPMTAAVAAANLSAATTAPPSTVSVRDVTELDRDALIATCSAAFVDPARRRDGRRLTRPDDWSPPLRWALDLPVPELGVKVAPGLDRHRAPDDTEFVVVSDRGAVVEAALYRGLLRDPGVSRRATLLPSGATVSDTDLPAGPPRVASPGRYLHEPDGAVIRAGLVAAVVDQTDGWLIDPQIAYLSTDQLVSSPFLASYEVLAVMPFSLKRLRAHLRAEGVGQVVVKKRGSAIDVDDLRRALRLDRKADGRRAIVLTRLGSDPIALVCSNQLR